MEEIAGKIAFILSTVAELAAMAVISIALARFLFHYIKTFFSKHQHIDHVVIRVKFGSSLTLALELLLAADILLTAVAPSWEDVGKLAAIAAIRTGLNYFIEKELDNLEKRLPDGKLRPE